MGSRSILLKLVLIVLLVSFLAGVMIFTKNCRSDKQPVEILVSTPTPSPVPIVKVFVSGAIRNEGVYTLTIDSRVEDAVTAAGGFSAEADRSRVNLAQKLRDGDWIKVPRPGETVTPPTTVPPPQKVNINRATVEELVSALTGSGIGQAKARAIVDFRNSRGPFVRAEDIIKVPGIGPAIYSRIKDLISVE